MDVNPLPPDAAASFMVSEVFSKLWANFPSAKVKAAKASLLLGLS